MTTIEMGPAPDISLHQDAELSENTFTVPNAPKDPLVCIYTGITHETLQSHESRDGIEAAKLDASERYRRMKPEDIDFGRAALALCRQAIADHKQATRVGYDAPIEFAQPVLRHQTPARNLSTPRYRDSEHPSAFFEDDAA